MIGTMLAKIIVIVTKTPEGKGFNVDIAAISKMVVVIGSSHIVGVLR